MRRAVIIEDEKQAATQLAEKIKVHDADIIIEKVLSSVKDSVSWFSANKLPDLIFLDIHLSDGLSFHIFKEVKINTPVIFTSTFNTYLQEAFELNSIDYLLKPVETEKLALALNKFNTTSAYYSENVYRFAQAMTPALPKPKLRLIARRGTEYIPVKSEDVVLFYTENRLTFLIDKHGKKYIIDEILSQLETELDKNKFYRANRQYIINVDFIKRYKTIEKVKIAVEIDSEVLSAPIVVSQDGAAEFREWITKT